MRTRGCSTSLHRPSEIRDAPESKRARGRFHTSLKALIPTRGVTFVVITPLHAKRDSDGLERIAGIFLDISQPCRSYPRIDFTDMSWQIIQTRDLFSFDVSHVRRTMKFHQFIRVSRVEGDLPAEWRFRVSNRLIINIARIHLCKFVVRSDNRGDSEVSRTMTFPYRVNLP